MTFLFQCEDMLIISLDVPGILNNEFIPQGQVVDNISMRMFYIVHWKTCGKNDVKSGVLKMDFLRTTAFSLCFVWEFVSSNVMTVVSHPPYSLGLAP